MQTRNVPLHRHIKAGNLLLHWHAWLHPAMGIKGLTKLLTDNASKALKECRLQSYFGRKIAIDASMSIYQFLIVVGRTGTQMLTNESGEVTSYVFDGTPPDLKNQELVKRSSRREGAIDDLAEAKETGVKEDIEKYSKRTVRVTKKHNENCKKLLKLMGVPVVEAPSEAEAECASLCKFGKVYAVASEDMDSLTFGASRLLRHLMDPSPKKIPVMEFEISKVLEELNLNMDQFIDLCILCGCDYCENIRGIGGQTALKLIRQYGAIETVLENIKGRYRVPENWKYQEARQLFKEPIVSHAEELEEAKWTTPDEEGLITFLVNENGFSHDRVTKAINKIKGAKGTSSQGRLDSFFKPVPTGTSSTKRKLPAEGSQARAIMNVHTLSCSARMGSQHWKSPQKSRLKCNVDASTFNDEQRHGFAAVVRDNKGMFVGCRIGHSIGVPNSGIAEAIAMREALRWLLAENLHQVDIETDSQTVFCGIVSNYTYESELGKILQECKEIGQNITGIEFSWAPREANRAAHCLARNASKFPDSFCWDSPPPVLQQILQMDLTSEASEVHDSRPDHSTDGERTEDRGKKETNKKPKPRSSKTK